MVACSTNKICKIKIGDTSDRAEAIYGFPHYFTGNLKVYKDKDNDNFIVTITSNQRITGIAVFSSGGELLYSKKLSPIDDSNILQFCSRPFDELEKQYGKTHFEIGSGFLKPAYVTDHATVVYFLYYNDKTVWRILSLDIITKELTILIDCAD